MQSKPCRFLFLPPTRSHPTALHSIFKYSLLAASLVVAYGALAQTGVAEPQQSMASSSSGELATVVITAEHRPVTIQKTAGSITAIGGEDLREHGQTTLESVLQDIPAVEMQASPQGGQIFIRGVGANGDSNWVDPSVSLNFDGIYSGRAERVFASMYDVDRVEILRGPQGTLYGRNATGGSINIISNLPARKLEGTLNSQVGNFSLRHLDGALNLPVGEILALRLALLREKRDGYFSNGGGASNLTGARLKALLKPSGDFSLLATIDTIQSKGLGTTSVGRAYSADVPPVVNWPIYPAYGNPWTVDSAHFADVIDARFTTYSLQADWNLGWAMLTALPSYTHSSRYALTNLILGDQTATTWEEDQTTAELRLSSPGSSAIKWVAGLYGFKSANVQTGTGVLSTFAAGTLENYGGANTPSNSRAAFGQLTIPLSDALRATAGIRYTRDRKDYTYAVRSTIGAYDSGLQTARNAYSALNYKAGIEYDLAPASLLYAQVSTGYKAGGFSTSAVPPVAYAPETLKAFELGSKNRFLGNRLQLNTELYYYQYDNFQAQYPDFAAPDPNPDCATVAGGCPNGVFDQFVVNAGRGVNQGGELELRYRATTADEFGAGISYAHARYGDFAIPALAYLNGTAVTNTPARAVNLSYEHTWDLANGATLAFRGAIKFSDGYRVTLARGMPGGDLNGDQPGYHRSNASLAYSAPADKWNLSAWVKNIENRAQLTNALPFGRVQVNDPRTLGVNLGYKF
jgi:iron complex outermembrane receptor protein